MNEKVPEVGLFIIIYETNERGDTCPTV